MGGELTGRVNCYVCEKCRAHMWTRNRDEGTTPFMVACHEFHGGICDGMAQSLLYRVPQDHDHGYVWIRPTEGELVFYLQLSKKRNREHYSSDEAWSCVERGMCEYAKGGGMVLFSNDEMTAIASVPAVEIDCDVVPSTYQEAVDLVCAGLSPGAVDWIKRQKTAIWAATMVHHGLGRWLRNNWSLWEAVGELPAWFKSAHGITHADDMSALILDAAFCRVCEEPFDLDRQVAVFLQHWENYK